MITAISSYVSASTLTLNLASSGEDEGLVVFNIAGLGSPKATVNGSGGPSFDGVLVDSVKTDARHILLTLAITPGGDQGAKKDKIYKYFPIKRQILFGVATPSKNVETLAYIENVEMNLFSKVANAVISLYCEEPFFFHEDETIKTFTTTPTDIIYEGHVAVGGRFFIDFTGVVTGDIVIINDMGDQSMTLDFDGARAFFGGAIQNGDEVVIDTRFGKKSAIFTRSSVDYNMIGGIGMYDDWIQMKVDPSATNRCSYTVNEPSNVTIDFNYIPAYAGV